FWKYARSYTKELYKVAQRVFSITVNTASIERIFSIMGWLHSPRRNRLKYKKVIAMTSLHCEMTQARRTREIQDSNTKPSSKPNNLNKDHRISEDCESGSHEGLRNWEQPENREIESFSEHETYRNVSSDEDTETDIEDDEMDAQ
ncbi:7255_t:CDS:2, partial [Acaulospora morrowiae]